MGLEIRHKQKNNAPTRYYSSKQENKVAENLKSGSTTANSGATPFQKGDILTDSFLIECKTVTKSQKQFTIKKEWIEKNREEQIQMNKSNQALVFSFGPDEENFYVIDEATFKMLTGE